MSTDGIHPKFVLQKRAHARATIRNSAGQVIFDSAVDRNWQGYLVREIHEFRDGNSNPPSEFREFTGTYEVVLEGAGGVRYTLTDNQDPALPCCIMQEGGKNPVIELTPSKAACLCFNDNVVTFEER